MHVVKVRLECSCCLELLATIGAHGWVLLECVRFEILFGRKRRRGAGIARLGRQYSGLGIGGHTKHAEMTLLLRIDMRPFHVPSQGALGLKPTCTFFARVFIHMSASVWLDL